MKEWGQWGKIILILYLEKCVEMKGKVPFSATLLWAVIEYKALWSSQTVWALWSREKSLASTGNRTLNREKSWLQPNNYIPPVAFYYISERCVLLCH
jgi:hypothetical protein